MSVHQLKDGRWIVQHAQGKDQTRPTANKRYFGRGVEAEAAARSFDRSLHQKRQAAPAPSSPVLMELAAEFLTSKRQVLAATTIARWQVRMRGTILPYLGALTAGELSPGRIERYAADRVQDGVKRTTIHREIADIRAVLLWATKRHLIASNPMAGYEMPTRDDARLSPPTEIEFRKILECAVPHLQRAMLVCWYTGLRPGIEELLGLRWWAVDMVGKTLMVISAVKGGIPKRNVPLCNHLLEHLAKWYQDDMLLGHGHLIHYNGRQVRSLKTAWKHAKRRAGITRRIRMYDLRHAFVSTLLSRGANIKAVSQIVGHASVQITQDVYQHVPDYLKRDAVDLLDS